MTSPPKPPPRKNVALPSDVVARVDAFRKSRNITSESDALRRLIETGLNFFDRPKDLFFRCAQAYENGSSIGEILENILNDHPLVEEITMRPDNIAIRLRDDCSVSLDKRSGEWSYSAGVSAREEYYPPRKSGWDQPSNIDEEIPF